MDWTICLQMGTVFCSFSRVVVGIYKLWVEVCQVEYQDDNSDLCFLKNVRLQNVSVGVIGEELPDQLYLFIEYYLEFNSTVKVPSTCTVVCGVLIFVFFVGRPNHEIWFSVKRRIPLIYILKTLKPQIQESINLCFFPDPRKLVSTN